MLGRDLHPPAFVTTMAHASRPTHPQRFKTPNAIDLGTGERVPSRRLNVLCALLALAFLLMPALPVVALVEDGGPEPPAVPAQTAPQGVVRTPYYVMATSGGPAAHGDLSPVAINESAVEAELSAPGQMIPRYLSTIVGTFTITLQAPIEVTKVDKLVVWAKGREPVTNAYFRVYFLRNGGERIAIINTPQQNMDLNPIAFEGQDLPIFSSPVKFAPGESMGIQIVYSAKSRRIIGPAPDAVVLASSYQHATRIEVSTRPMILNITTPVIVARQVQFTGQIVDSAGQSPDDRLKVQMSIIPATGATAKIGKNDIQVVTTSQTAVNGMNGYVINYTWDWKNSRATDGTYEFKLDCSYGVLGINYTNTSAFELKFPQAQQKTGFFQKKTNLYGLGAVIAIVVVVGVVLAWRRRTAYRRYARAYGGRSPRGYYGRPPPPPAGPPKVRRWGMKGKERPIMAAGAKATQGAPPPRNMPPQRRPEGRAPPPRTPTPARGSMPTGMPVAARPPPPMPRGPEGRQMPPPARGQMPPGRPMGARPPPRGSGGRPPPPQGAPRRGPPPQMGPDGRPMQPRGPPPRGARPPPPRGQAPPPREGDPRAVARRRPL